MTISLPASFVLAPLCALCPHIPNGEPNQAKCLFGILWGGCLSCILPCLMCKAFSKHLCVYLRLCLRWILPSLRVAGPLCTAAANTQEGLFRKTLAVFLLHKPDLFLLYDEHLRIVYAVHIAQQQQQQQHKTPKRNWKLEKFYASFGICVPRKIDM